MDIINNIRKNLLEYYIINYKLYYANIYNSNKYLNFFNDENIFYIDKKFLYIKYKLFKLNNLLQNGGMLEENNKNDLHEDNILQNKRLQNQIVYLLNSNRMLFYQNNYLRRQLNYYIYNSHINGIEKKNLLDKIVFFDKALESLGKSLSFNLQSNTDKLQEKITGRTDNITIKIRDDRANVDVADKEKEVILPR